MNILYLGRSMSRNWDLCIPKSYYTTLKRKVLTENFLNGKFYQTLIIKAVKGHWAIIYHEVTKDKVSYLDL